MNQIISLYRSIFRPFESIPQSVLLLLARVSIAGVFWQSARTKVDGWNIFQPNERALSLFEEIYATDWLPTSPSVEAHLATFGEHVFPVLLVLGLCTRVGAVGLLSMTVVIQTVNALSAWPTHLLWASILLLILTQGPGKISLDHLFGRTGSRKN